MRAMPSPLARWQIRCTGWQHSSRYSGSAPAADLDKAPEGVLPDYFIWKVQNLSGPMAKGCFLSAGVRSVGPLWSRPNRFGVGVPFSFPGHPDRGPGLTDSGKALIAACDEMNILLDVSHLNEAGFWDIARLSGYPLIASHSNAYALCPSPRNLTDKQLDAIAASGGLVGACFATAYLRRWPEKPGYADRADHPPAGLSDRQVGEDHVGLGSDFDGAVLPASLADCACLPRLIQAMQNHGSVPT